MSGSNSGGSEAGGTGGAPGGTGEGGDGADPIDGDNAPAASDFGDPNPGPGERDGGSAG